MKKLLGGTFFIFIFVACSRNETQDTDRELPVITLISPVNNQVFNAGQTITISGTLSDNQKLAEVHVHISNNSTGVLLEDIHRYPAASSYTLNESFIAQSGIPYKIQIIAKDNSANESHSTVQVTVN